MRWRLTEVGGFWPCRGSSTPGARERGWSREAAGSGWDRRLPYSLQGRAILPHRFRRFQNCKMMNLGGFRPVGLW